MLLNAVMLGAFVGLSTATRYTLQEDFLAGDDFFSKFDFFTGADPTHGFVDYLDQADASAAGLISASSTKVTIAADSNHVAANGRQSVRISSKQAFNSGLVVLDLEHMPGGICGTWPAFWMLGPDWPNHGEIDIIEGVNQGTTNGMTLHTRQGCTIQNNGMFTGQINTNDCWVNDPNQSGNAGCSIGVSNTNTYGAGFNNIGGGVYATVFNTSAVSIWFFPRGNIPIGIYNGNPMPQNWGKPLAQFQGSGCDIDSFINNQQLVFDLTFCGDWAGNVWSGSSCASKANTCQAFVQNNPSAFSNAYWSIKGLRVYQVTG